MNSKLSFCTFEERPRFGAGMKLLAISFQKHAPLCHLAIYLDPAMAELKGWLQTHCPQVEVIDFRPATKGFAVKADVLGEALQRWEQAIWIDSDVMVLRDLAPVLASIPPGGMLTTANTPHALDPNSGRAEGLGLGVARHLEYQVNAALVGLGREHLPLLRVWKEIMEGEDYLANQQISDYTKRNPALAGDQEVLEGLLASDHPAGFGNIPIRQLKCGLEIVHEVNLARYPVKHRIRNSLSGARSLYFCHLQGVKPWQFSRSEPERIPKSLASSFYMNTALAYRDQVDEPLAEWGKPLSRKSRWSRILTFNHPHLQGALWILLKKYLGRFEPKPK